MPVGTGTGVSTITPGANDYALLSDSSTATGLKWASLAAVGTVIPNTFSSIAVSGQTTVSADQQADTLTLTAGSNISLTTNNTTNTVTITGSNSGVTTHEAAADPHAQYLTTAEASSVYEQIGAASLAQTAAAAYTDTAISNLVNSAPTTLNTLKELSDALGGDAAFATTVTNSIAAKAPIASPTFTGTVTTDAITTGALSSTAVTAPTYASTPRTLTYSGSTISWNPTQGLNAAITLTQNSTLSFTAAPPVGSYGTVVLTQDATGNRTITLPTITNVTNKVLGSTSTSTVALSTAANSKDILNFYYDGTVVYWNIGQGYGSAATTAAATNLATSVS
jgi:hypothetical protein